MLVKHKLSPAFGMGEIVNINNETLTIEFQYSGTMSFDSNFAPLEILPASDRKSHLALLKGLFHEYKFQEAERYFHANTTFFGQDEYNRLEGGYRQKQKDEKTLLVRKNLENLLSSYNFDKAYEYYQQNNEYVDSEWYRYSEIHYRQVYKIEQSLQKYQFIEADSLCRLHKDCFDSEEYITKKAAYIKAWIQLISATNEW